VCVSLLVNVSGASIDNHSPSLIGWMKGIVFRDWIKNFNRRMKTQKRHVLLIMDNAPSHPIDLSCSNVKVHFLPPTTTSHLQPLDAGIIASFKRHYRRYQIKHLVQCIDDDHYPAVILREAIKFVSFAWTDVTLSTIINCWQHTGLIDRPSDTPAEVDDPEDDVSLAENIRRVATSTGIHSNDVMPFTDFCFVDADIAPCETLSDEEILTIVRGDKDGDMPVTCDDDDDEEPPPIPSVSEARQALLTFTRYFDSLNDVPDEATTSLKLVSDTFRKNCSSRMKQKTILDFFS